MIIIKMVRHKNRYVVLEIDFENERKSGKLLLNSLTLHNAILEKLEQLHGDFGVAACKSGFVAKYCNEKTRVAVVRIRHGPHRLVTSILPFVTKIGSSKVKLTTLYVGATIRRCFMFLKKFQEERVERFYSSLNTKEEKEQIKEMLLDFSSLKNVT